MVLRNLTSEKLFEKDLTIATRNVKIIESPHDGGSRKNNMNLTQKC